MIRRLSGAVAAKAPASLPLPGLPGLDPRWSRLVTAAESPSGIPRTWHVLDTGPVLDERGATPVGTILCVHGNPTWSFLWRSVLQESVDAALRGDPAWRVVAVDQLEMGFSERTGEHRPLTRRVRDLSDLTEALGLDGPVVTFGHDWGGVVSLGWAVDHAETVSAVMLLNTAVHQAEDEPIPAPLRVALRPGMLTASTVTTPAFLETTLALAHPPLDPAVREGYRAPYRTADRRSGIGGFVADIPVDQSHESRAELDRIAEGVRRLDVPALLLWGPRDPIFSDRYLDDLVDRLQHPDVHRFEGAGHLVAEDRDIAAPAFAWLEARGVPRTLEGAAVPDAEQKASFRPLWSTLDALAHSDEVALVEMAPGRGPSPRTVSWRLLARRVQQLAAGLVAAGVRPGDRVSLLVPPGADLTAVLYACLRIGAVVVVADAGLGLRGLTRAVRGTWPDHVIGAAPGLIVSAALRWPGRRIATARYPRAVSRALGVQHTVAGLLALGEQRSLQSELPAPGEHDPAAILFTSGSTGPAKGVLYTHGQLAGIRDALASRYGVGVGTGLVAGFAPFALLGPALGARSVTPDMDVTAPKTLTARAVAAAVAVVDATVVFLSPAALANVDRTSAELTEADRAALRGVRRFLSAGAPVPVSLLTAASALMPEATAHTPYGMTEALLLTDISLEELRTASEGDDDGICVGRPLPVVRVLVSALDEHGAATGAPSAEPGITGEIVVSAPHLKTGYDRLWLTDQESRRGVPAEGRWHRTGDVGHLDAGGRLWIEGRMPHVISTSDGPVTPVGPEQRIERTARVRRAAAVGVGPRGVQQVVAVVETDPPARTVALADVELAAEVRRRAGVPIAAVLVVPELPTDIRHNSKIDRARLSRWASGVLAGGRMTRP